MPWRSWPLGGATGYVFVTRPAPPTAAAQPAPPATDDRRRDDLTTSVTLNGSLGYGKATVYTGRKAGTLTWLPAVGTVVHRGGRLYTVDAQPVVLFVGDLPLYRTIDPTATPGPDVREVNANLRALGYRTAPHRRRLHRRHGDGAEGVAAREQARRDRRARAWGTSPCCAAGPRRRVKAQPGARRRRTLRA